MKYHFKLELYKVIKIVDEKGYEVIPIRVDNQYKVFIYFNDQFLREGVVLFDDFNNCIEESYYKLYNMIK